MDVPLLENDLGSRGVIEAGTIFSPIDIPECVVYCFFGEVVDQLLAQGATQIASLKWEHQSHRVLEIEHQGRRIAVVHAGVGAPVAAGVLEEVIALGGRTFVAVGGAGALVRDLVMGHAIVVDSAVRDEGTSLHYAAPSRTIDADPAGVAALQAALTSAGLPSVTGRTWTTDAPYRETRERVDRRVAEGCLAVEMEAAALLAVARYRDVGLAQLLYAGDSLAEPEWQHRGWQQASDVRQRLLLVAADACLALAARASGS